MLIAATTLAIASFFLVPQAIRGMGAPELPADRPPSSEARLVAFEALRILLRSCRETIAVHPDDATGLTELVLWHRDEDLDNAIDPSELVVLTHSSFLGQISATTQGWQPSKGDSNYERLTRAVDRGVALAPGFASKWRARPDIETKVIAVGIDSFRLEDLSRKFGHGTYRVVLRWSPNVSDAVEDGVSWFHVAPQSE